MKIDIMKKSMKFFKKRKITMMTTKLINKENCVVQKSFFVQSLKNKLP